MPCLIAGTDIQNTPFFYLWFSSLFPLSKLSNSFEFYKQTDGFGKLHWHFSHSHSCGQNRTMRVYHYPVIAGRGKATFPTVALGSLRGSLASRYGKGRGVQSPWLAVSQTCPSTLFSCQRTAGESLKRLSCEKRRAGQERGGF